MISLEKTLLQNKYYNCEWAIKYGYEIEKFITNSLILTATLDFIPKKF